MRVLIAVDGSKYSDAALDSVTARQWPPGSHFMVLSVAEHVISTNDPTLTQYEASAMQDIADQHRRFMETSVAWLKRKLPDSLITGVVCEGNAADQIVYRAKEWGADFIVMGSHGRTRLRRFLLGSVAESVVSKAPCSVEIIKSVEATTDHSASDDLSEVTWCPS